MLHLFSPWPLTFSMDFAHNDDLDDPLLTFPWPNYTYIFNIVVSFMWPWHCTFDQHNDLDLFISILQVILAGLTVSCLFWKRYYTLVSFCYILNLILKAMLDSFHVLALLDWLICSHYAHRVPKLYHDLLKRKKIT